MKPIYYWATALVKRFRAPLILIAAFIFPFALGDKWGWLCDNYPGTVLVYVGALIMSSVMYVVYVVDKRTQ